MLKSCSPLNSPETLRALREMWYSGQRRFPCGIIFPNNHYGTNGTIRTLRLIDIPGATQKTKPFATLGEMQYSGQKLMAQYADNPMKPMGNG